MEKVATPTPKKEEKKAIPPKAVVTPTVEKKEKPTTPTDEVKKIAELEGEVDRLKIEVSRQTARASTSDRIALKEKRESKKLAVTLQAIRVSGEIPEEETFLDTPDDREEKYKARIGIQNLLLGNAEYQKLLEKDITLREVMQKNPFALISDWVDVEDAVSQIKNTLDNKLLSLKESPPKEEKKEEGKEFEVGAIQPKESIPPKTETSSGKALKEGNIEGSILSKIKVKVEGV